MAGMSRATLVGEGPLVESSVTMKQCEISPIDGRMPATFYGEPSSGAGISSSIQDMAVHGQKMMISMPSTNVNNLTTLLDVPFTSQFF